MERLPVRLVLSPMAQDEQERRLYLGNLSRFEVDENTRLILNARVWPGYYSGKGDAPKLAEIAKAQGVTERQVKRDKVIMKEAAEIAGSETVKPEHVQAARDKKNEARRSLVKSPDDAIIRVRRAVLGLKEKAEACDEGSEAAMAYLDAVRTIQEALG